MQEVEQIIVLDMVVERDANLKGVIKVRKVALTFVKHMEEGRDVGDKKVLYMVEMYWICMV